MKILGIIIFLTSLTYIKTDAEELHSLQQKIENNHLWSVVFPGTKWCGRENRAAHENQLGKFRITDACCRTHDKCGERIRGGEEKFGIKNNSSITILSCQCDKTFYECLKTSGTIVSNIIGAGYFDFVRNKCYEPSKENNERYILTNSLNYSENELIRRLSDFWGRTFG